MYRVAVERDFIAQHYLIGGDWGEENKLHSHHYILSLELAGASLDEHNYLVDIEDINRIMDSQVSKYRDKTLNDFPEFIGTNPSLEYFSRILCEALSGLINGKSINRISVKLWENASAWASYEQER